jgi:malate dehydrogenase (oxaloacetate-decarboxylating)
MSDIYQASLELHKKYRGKLETKALLTIKDKSDLSLLYTPGVAGPSRAIAKDKNLSYDLTLRGRTVAVISDGSAVLGLGNIGPEAAMPVMEGKALLLKEFGGVDAVPLVIDAFDASSIVRFVKQVAPSFAGINLEDIAAPKCFEVEDALQHIGIPVFHDDQHGTAIVVKAALMNAAKVVNKPYESLKVVVVGAGAAGLATARMLLGLDCSKNSCLRIAGTMAVADVIVVDSQGALYLGREDQNIYKQAVARMSNKQQRKGLLAEIIHKTDAVIGLSAPNILSPQMIRSMNEKPIVFAMANPIPEIMPDAARGAGAYIIATGRSDFPNQINNALAFPGVFRAVVKGRLKRITHQMKENAALKLATLIPKPTSEKLLPDIFFPNLAEELSSAILEVS